MDRELIHSKIKSLVQKFEANKYHYLSKNYGEEEVKVEFINPLFEALGWDVRNTKGLSPYEKDVVFEKGETVGHPDYNFRIDGQTRFYIEAKAPHEPLHKINHVLQAKSYAWNTKSVFIVLLTDFEEFRLFDATIKPDPKHPDQGIIFELTYDQYLDNLDKLILISKEEVEKDSLDKLLLKDSESRKLRKPVDEAFLEDISIWREKLAKDIYKNNIEELEDKTDEGKTKVQIKILNEAVQKILDRLIFIRIAEDRKIIEPKSLLDEVDWWKAGGKRRDLQRRLIDRFLGWNQDFNGEILKPGPCDVLAISSKLLAGIIEGLYFPKCPYRFEVIGAELLGSIYERYLGKTIRVTPKRVKIEEKPEVRKAGGVFYTPQYIVDYIVKNTVDKKIKGKTPKQLEKIKILDPACGSGSFLLTAYQALIYYHLQYYEKHPEESGKGTLFPDLITDFNGKKRLSIEKKAQILKNNIFGVDIDPQAVEIAMMSLYLKCLERERDLPRKRELLPSLAKNIRCGNSLVSYDIFDQMTLFDEEEKERINPFDWYSKATGFGEIMETGGFHIIIGNPPYIRMQLMREWASSELDFYRKLYKAASKGNYDIYTLFLEKAICLVNKKGKIGFILPNKFFKAKYGEPIRKIISKGRYLSEVVHFGNQQVFPGATTYTCLLFLNKAGTDNFRFIKVNNLTKWKRERESAEGKIPTDNITAKEWNLIVGPGAALFERLNKIPIKLGGITKRIFQGIIPGMDEVYSLTLVEEHNDLAKCYSRALECEIQLESRILRKIASGSQVHAYRIEDNGTRVIFPYQFVLGGCVLIPPEKMKRDFPLTFSYFQKTRELLNKRDRGSAIGAQWYRYIRTQNIALQTLPKIAVPRLVNRLRAAYDENAGFCLDNVDVGGIILGSENPIDPLFLLALLNSKLLNFFFKNNSVPFRGGFYSANRQYLEQLPIYIINFENSKEKNIHDKILMFVDKMIQLKTKRERLQASSQREKIEREIQITDEKIDELVYELYGIKEEERKIIEKGI